MQKMADLANIKEDEEYDAGEPVNSAADGKDQAKVNELEPISPQAVGAPMPDEKDDLNWEVNENQAPANFYDTLFSAAHLKVTFRKYKEPVRDKSDQRL
eukprot:TRINITY_DN965_c0_g1_i1.p1 TRINITY_DN965_c0_g1~~TRINITY_DN965_c0_g1_i1.p1  ORF type:complete len:99 (-),score=23.87 TRINITY_DN965_c0_g1_i1:232-528(-)